MCLDSLFCNSRLIFFFVPALLNFAKKFPKRPGVFPPFALFTQEQREKMLAENADTVKSFGDSGRMMGELWHKLSDEQKEDYRKRRVLFLNRLSLGPTTASSTSSHRQSRIRIQVSKEIYKGWL